ncbi:MAG TPA: hypothetical protein PK646_02850 [Bacillota bacterium]|jgi:hypothetical protein|nr:hypothetical protein [Fastidiosipila sp.]HPX92643.1 hypothetical protein [Bacillota bacterium]HQB81010.1 hypothetical protein [Bacillota bacterium]
MNKPQGTLFISIGSAGLAVLGGLGILISPFVITLTALAGSLLRGLDPVIAKWLKEGAYPIGTVLGRVIGGAGVMVGILMLLFSSLQLTCGILTWKRKDDVTKYSFALAMGIAFAITSLALGLTAPGLIQLALSVLLIVGATLNRQQTANPSAAEDAAG